MSRLNLVLLTLVVALLVAVAYLIGARNGTVPPGVPTNESRSSESAEKLTEINDAMPVESGSSASIVPKIAPAKDNGIDITKKLKAEASQAWSDFRNGKSGAEERHTRALNALVELNVCWGKVGQYQAEYDFHRCDKDSLQKQPAPAVGSDAALCNSGDQDACMRL